MPYLKASLKEQLDRDVKLHEVEGYLAEKFEPQDFAGIMNYMNYRLVKTYIGKRGKRYWIFALIVGTLVCCVLEIYRRLVAGYEDEKINDPEYGDV